MTVVDAARAVAGLRELRRLTGDENGAQRVAWTETWITARDWLARELAGIDGVTVERDEAGNTWATAPGASDRFVIVGGHLDSVPTAAGSTARSTSWPGWRCCVPWRPSGAS
jgi:allantoate deiminase